MVLEPVTVIVLAAQRAGTVNPLAKAAGVSHKCLVPICGKPLILHVVETLATVPAITGIRVVIEPEGRAEVNALLDRVRSRGCSIELIDSHANIVESVLHAAGDDPGPFIVTTADNVLLTHDAIERVRAEMVEADGVIAVTTRECVWEVHPQGQRNFYQLKEAAYANCNLYGIANRKGLATAEMFREGGQFQANKMRVAHAFGLLTLMLMWAKLITLQTGFDRAGKRFGAKLKVARFEDGALAIDVDNERTYAIAEWVLAGRLGMDVPKPDIAPEMS